RFGLREALPSKEFICAHTCLQVLAALEDALAADWTWKRQTSRLVESMTGAKFWVVKKKPTPSRGQRLPNTASSIFKYFAVFPRELTRARAIPMRVRMYSVDNVLHKRLEEIGHQPSGYVAHFEQGVELEHEFDGDRLFFTGVKDVGGHLRSICNHLEAAADSTFMVLPECTVCPTMMEDIKSAISSSPLPPVLCLAGSFHCRDDPSKLPYNRGELIDYRGERVGKVIKSAPASLGMNGQEGISVEETMDLVSTPLGLVGLAICLDFSHPTQAVWEEVEPDWMLVPSMGDQRTLDVHRDAAEKLRNTFNTTSLIANQPAEGAGHPGFIVEKGVEHNEDHHNQVVSLTSK
ncbi:MAG: hypothetical protein AAF513_00800, partial [Pseudomonadota bacterium]